MKDSQKEMNELLHEVKMMEYEVDKVVFSDSGKDWMTTEIQLLLLGISKQIDCAKEEIETELAKSDNWE